MLLWPHPWLASSLSLPPLHSLDTEMGPRADRYGHACSWLDGRLKMPACIQYRAQPSEYGLEAGKKWKAAKQFAGNGLEGF